MGYPPAEALMAVHGSGEDEELLKTAMTYISRFVHKLHTGTGLRVIGPAPESIGKIRDVYRMVLYLKHADARVLNELRRRIEKYISINSGFQSIYIQFDLTVQPDIIEEGS